jgi:hypothetical protein
MTWYDYEGNRLSLNTRRALQSVEDLTPAVEPVQVHISRAPVTSLEERRHEQERVLRIKRLKAKRAS